MTSLDLLTSLDLDFDPIAPKIELDLRITIMYLPTKFHQVWSNNFSVILYTDGRTDGRTDGHTEAITISRFSRDNYSLVNGHFAQSNYVLSHIYRPHPHYLHV